MRGELCLGIVFTSASLAFAGDAANVRSLVERSIAAEKSDWNLHRDFSFLQTERDDGGPLKTYAVTNLYGTRYRRQVAENGRPFSPARQAEEDRKFREESEKRKRESPADRARRVEKGRKDRDQELTMLLEMAKAFDFRVVGTQTLEGRPTWVLDANPKPGYAPPNQHAKVLLGMHGKMWIAEDGYHWAKITAEVVKPVLFEGFLARVGPGTRFEMEKAPYDGGTWQPKHFAFEVQAKLLGLFSKNLAQEDSFSDYRRISPREITAQSR